MAGVIIPKTYVADIRKPLIFLAGPIRSAPNWQDVAIETILKKDSDLVIASPRRGVRDSIANLILKGDDNHFERQRAWELHYLDIASKRGAIMFWLPGEEKHSCEKVYGAITRMELGQWMVRSANDRSVRLCIGSDGNFPELSTIRYDLLHIACKQII